MKTIAPAVVGAAVIASPCLAGFTGWTAFSRVSGSVLLVDVFAGFSDQNARALLVFDANIAVTGASFLQQSSIQRRGWAPAADQGRGDHDSFMTLGSATEDGTTYVGWGVQGDPSFTGTPGAWAGTPGSAPSTAVPTRAGWYCVPDGTAAGQLNPVALASFQEPGAWQRRTGTHGVWVAHFAFNAASIAPGAALNFDATVGYREAPGPGDPTIGQQSTQFILAVPAPGVSMAMLALSRAVRNGRRRRA